ncbi:MAG TPA: glycoside hydrolase family 43 protein [Steroidobacteraceae bacterium]|nr:glycoside hydrolase family 43 protein [Steroidobacteraceae bacterium]
MKWSPVIRAFCLIGSAALAGCGGGGSGSASSSSSSSSSGGTPPPPAISFVNASVHDPSVIKVGAEYWVFGSHLAAARSTDLMNWTLVADGVNNANPLFTNVLTTLQQTFTWSQVNDLWAPDVVKLASNKFYFYYDSCRGDSPLSALGVAVADSINGPYTNPQQFLRSGMQGLSDDGITNYDARVHPNVVDPHTFFDATGNLWMVYGSYSGGIFILAMNETTGLPESGQGYGRHLSGGNHARIEGAYVLHNPQTGFYYLFTSFGGLAANGAYNIRVARSQAPDGPYFDAAGTDMATVRGNPAVLFDDAPIAPHGQKLMGNHEFALAAGETGAAPGYVSPGHNSAYYDAGLGKYFLIFHTRFPGRGEQHEIRVHELLFNSQGWPVVAPFRYAPHSMSPTPVVAEITNADVPGAYKVIDHGEDMSATVKPSQAIRLNADGTMSGALTGTWIHRGGNLIDVALSGVIYHGVLSRQWNTNANRFVVTFSAQARYGASVWGARTGE